MSEQTEMWHVQVAAGDVRTMTLDQLDEAFQNGLIDESTYVLQQGNTKWAQLGEVAGLDEPEPAPPARAPATRAHAPVAHAFVEPPSFGFNGLNSMRPVVSEISDLELEPARFRSKKRGVFIGFAAVMLLGGGAFAAARAGVLRLPIPGTTMAAAAVEAPPPPAPVVTTSANITAAVTPSTVQKPAEPVAAKSDARLTDEQKKALLDADTKRTAKQKARVQAAPVHHHKSSGTPFHAGGNPHDPLNSAL